MRLCCTLPVGIILLPGVCSVASRAQETGAVELPSAADLQVIVEQRDILRTKIATLREKPELLSRDAQALLADVGIFEKAASWMLRFEEFPKKDYIDQLREGSLKRNHTVQMLLRDGTADWTASRGTTVRGYVSTVDGSVQPYAITLPDGVDPKASKRWPLHVVLHGRADQMNEVNFIHRMDGKPLPDERRSSAAELDSTGCLWSRQQCVSLGG